MLILASNSPRRKQLLKDVGFNFEVIPSTADEQIDQNSLPQENVVSLAKAKANEVFSSHPESIVIGADTIVCLEGKVFGKPADNDDARRMLTQLSGKTHSVFTGVSVVGKDIDISFFEETKVTFHPLSVAEIEWYVATGEPLDKAGAYGIQGKGMILTKHIEGDFYNVMGLPISWVYRILCDLI